MGDPAFGWQPPFAGRRLLAGVTTRHGGLSTGPYRSLNLGLAVGDAPESVAANRQRLRSWCAARWLLVADQEHGRRVICCDAETGTSLQTGVRHVGAGDALLTDHPGLALLVTVADCAPAFIAAMDAEGPAAIGLVHAGWRGTVAGVVPTALRRLRDRYGGDLRIHFAVGPAIGPCCYEVGSEVAAAAKEVDLTEALVRCDGRWRFDLWRANRLQAARLGVRMDGAAPRPPCTSCDHRFYSHRANGPATGRMGAIIMSR